MKNLRNYLYGVNKLNIFTDHQPLIFAISEKNPNSKLKRWKAFVEEFAPTFHYKPGRDNVVADALSRQYNNMIFHLSSSSSLDVANSEESYTEVIPTVVNPLNCFRNQIILTQGTENKKQTKIIFKDRVRHTIHFSNIEQVFGSLKQAINPNVVNAIHCDLPILAQIQHLIVTAYPSVKILHTGRFVTDIFNTDDQLEILNNEHLVRMLSKF